MKDILEEAGVKSVSTSVQVWGSSAAVMSAYVDIFLDPQKKIQKRKFKDGNFDEDMETEPQLKYKCMTKDVEVALVIILG